MRSTAPGTPQESRIAEATSPPVGAPPGNGQSALAEAPPAPAHGAAPRRRRLLLLIPVLAVVGLVGLVLALRFWYESTYFVITENAQVTGDLVQVGSLNAGQVVEANLEVGRPVTKDQVIAVVAVPQAVGSVPFSETPLLEQTDSLNTRVPVRAPVDGVIAARLANVGATVSAGQAIYALVNPRRIWINANIDEDKVSRVQPGQPVEVYSRALDRHFAGRVEAVTPASAATFSLLPAQNLAGTFNRVTQWVPVKIVVDRGDTVLPLGTSVDVRIRVREGGPLPWLQ